MAEFKRRTAPGIRQNWEAHKAAQPTITPKPAIKPDELAEINRQARAKRPTKQFGMPIKGAND